MTTAPAMTVAWLDLLDAAMNATRRGWLVTPGTYLGPDRRWRGRHDAQGLGPIEDAWRDTVVSDPVGAREVWTRAPYSVLLVCGRALTVLELPSTFLGLLPALQGAPVAPVVVTGSPPRFLVLTTTDTDEPLPELTDAGMLLHGTGAWVALPPTFTDPVLHQRWLISPPQGPTAPLSTTWAQWALRAALVGLSATRGGG